MRAASALHSGSASDTGLHRASNEDRIWADDSKGLYLVVDGLGGHAAGDVAAQIAVDVIVRELGTGEWKSAEDAVRSAIVAANNEIHSMAEQDPANAGMACVLTLATVRDDVVTVGHVGDSRLYLIWNGTIRKLTSDHSPVGEQEDQGELTEVEAMRHPRRNEVFRDVGSRERAAADGDFVELRSFPFHPTAALLLCTDGLSDAVASSDIGAIVATYDGDASVVAESLVQAANESGGSDNVSVIFVPGPDFIGGRSEAMSAARTRHGITRMRRQRSRWKRRAGRAVWLLVGIALGIAILAFVQRLAMPGGWLR